jgi:hypothetical protein
VGLAIFLVTLCYAWAFLGSSQEIWGAHPNGYYGLLTDALTSGQLHLKIEPDPRLAELPNPWAGAQGIPRVHDATYYHGHYYLYFGVTPVIILFAPWRVFTDTFLVESFATVLFGWIGFLMSARLWLRIRASWFSELNSVWNGLGVLFIGLGSYVYFLLETPVFYHVPIVCAFMCVMIALNLVEAGLSVESGSGRQTFYFAISSLFWALCVGARPNYILGLPLFGLLTLWCAFAISRNQLLPKGRAVRLLVAAVLPATIVGAGLASYNYARFGSVTEFGVKYQFASIDQRFLKLTDIKNFWPTLKSYLTAHASYTPYYPFIEERVDVIGVLRWAPFCVLAILAPLSAFRTANRRQSHWSGVITILFLLTFAHLASLCLLPFANDRYVVDFLPEATLLAIIVSADWLQVSRHRRLAHLLVAILVVSIGTITFAHANLLAIQRNASAKLQKTLAQISDSVAPTWEKVFHTPVGRVDLTIRFNNLAPRQIEPIVSSSEGRDNIYVEYVGDNKIRFGYFHFGTGGPTGDSIPVEIGKSYHISVDMGSLYPPPEHPAFRGWETPAVDALHRRIEVRFEGRKVLQWTASFYDSNPFLVQIGKNTKSLVTARHFDGVIDSVVWHGMPSQDQVPSVPGDGPIRLTVKFPPFTNIVSQPLISTGRPGAGDLVYVTYLSATSLRFGHDSWGAGAIETIPVEYDPNKIHTIDIDMGSLHAGAQGLENEKYKLKIRLDNDYIIATNRPFHPSSPLDISLGYDTTRSTAASPFFTGPTLTATRIPSMPELAPATKEGWGAMRLVISRLAPTKNEHEPLLVTGTSGAGDFIYLIYVDSTHIQIGYDHWGLGGTTSEPIAVNLTRPLDIKVSTAALYPLVFSKEWNDVPEANRRKLLSTTTVTVNDKVALNYPSVAYSASSNEIYLGSNPIGGSSCNPMLNGVIVTAQRLKLGTMLNAN